MSAGLNILQAYTDPIHKCIAMEAGGNAADGIMQEAGFDMGDPGLEGPAIDPATGMAPQPGEGPMGGEPGPMDGPPPGDMPPMDDMGEMHTHMDDAAAHSPGDPGPGTPDPMACDMDGDGMMPPPPTDDPVDDGMA